MGNTQSSGRDANLCTTPECISIANGILSKLAPNYHDLDPYACGGYYETTALGLTDLLKSDQGDQLIDNSVLISNVLEKPYDLYATSSPSPLDEAFFIKLQTAYLTCMDEETILEIGTAPLNKLLEGFLEVFPLGEDDYANPKNLTEEDYELTRTAWAALAKMGVPAFFVPLPQPDADDASVYIPGINIVKPGTAIALQAKELLLPTLQLLLPNSTAKSAEVLALGLVELDTKLALIYPGDGYNVPYKEFFATITFDEAAKLVPALDIPGALGQISPASKEKGRLSWGFPEVAAATNEILLGTTKPAIQAYFMWQIIQSFLPAVNSPELALVNPPTKARREICTADLGQRIPFLASKVYLDKVYTDEVDTTLNQLVSNIHSGVQADMDNLEWASEAARAAFKDKLSKLVPNVGYSRSKPNNKLAQEVAEFYEPLNVTDNYFGFVTNSNAFNVVPYLTTMLNNGAPDREQWNYLLTTYGSAETVNAQYQALLNAIFIPYGMAQANHFSPSAPGYIQYGGIGYIIAHEFIHSLDTKGSQVGPDGSIYPGGAEQWIDEPTLAAYGERAKCIAEQSSSWTVLINGTEEIPQNGTDKLNEDLADSGGVNVAFRAWQRRQAHDQDLPGLQDEFTHEQLFYLANAGPWCSVATAAVNASYVDGTDHHSIAYARINNMVLNSRGFREAFGCPVKEPTCELF
ncbi:uncharacterized protein B0I36DRAFT_389280 [Microdochium trichocladiopsis]|uniref:Peptidase family M13 n=1 Tax=Microdochium trichocladiopsis TaxID=1682393 RepID=A0A9P8XS23_9PEZI|nr:uncharacterized protein B0I36DRAFT_389280 [Microdochium trichocladiopsis]KAH7014362.1 hypothetical protein B0I36DRAFT_389280 [Microdochium trichocladiopsis]